MSDLRPAPISVVEFPHKSGPMVHTLLYQREDIFPDYDHQRFAKLRGERARIVKQANVLPARRLYWCDRS